MREKSLKLILSFEQTTAAMAMEELCKRLKLPGRLIPLPREISAGCGLAWCAEPEEQERLEAAARQADIPIAGCCLLLI